jgi:hypothetical protein
MASAAEADAVEGKDVAASAPLPKKKVIQHV